MKKVLLLLISIHLVNANNLQLAVSGAQTARMPLTIFVINDKNKELHKIATIIQKDLQFTDQFTVAISTPQEDEVTSKKLLKNTIKKLCSQGTPLALCLNADDSEHIQWRLYDTMQCSMLNGKQYKKKGDSFRGWSHALADNVLKTLTGNEGFFSSKIVYCKESKTKNGQSLRRLYMADYDGSNPELLVENTTPIVAPRWNIDKKNPLIFYSEYGDTNVRLMSVDMNKNTRMASNLDGINMLPSFSSDGKSVVYCASNGDGNCQLYLHTKGKLQSFTRNNGNNVSPIFIDDEHICFCSDAQTGNPQIYIGNMKTGHVQRITKGGYCTSPSYCKKNNTIAYHAKVKGVMQLFLYNCSTKQHTQVTTGTENKHEACWSPCGTQLIFAQESEDKSRIVSLNLTTNKTKYLTPANERCSYPHWSPYYTNFPVVI